MKALRLIMSNIFTRLPAWAFGLVFTLLAVNTVFVYYLTFGVSPVNYAKVPSFKQSVTFIQNAVRPRPGHPIDDLLKWSRQDFDAVLKNRTHGVAEAAKAYRERRGRHPPPGFAEWVKYAEDHDAIIVEDFWDRIYDDLEPFWGINPWVIRDMSKRWTGIITVRDGAASLRVPIDADTAGSARYSANPRAPRILEMIKSIESLLPDVDMAIAGTAEPKISAEYERVAEALRFAGQHKAIPSADSEPGELMLNYPSWAPLPERYLPKVDVFTQWRTTDQHIAQWYYTRQTCHPQSRARELDITDYNGDVPRSDFPRGWPEGSHEGYVRNWTLAKSVCDNPSLRNLHGALIAPLNKANQPELFPLFGGIGIQGSSNDIVTPSAMYWTALHEWPNFRAPNMSVPWDKKHDDVRWFGEGTGGEHDESNWQRFPRFRLLSMLNATHVMNSDDRSASARVPHNFPFPNETAYPLKAIEGNSLPSMLGEWVDSFSHTSLTDYRCHPQDAADSRMDDRCAYLQPYYKLQMEEPLRYMFSAKYLVDLDDDGESTRYLAYLLSDSLPIKATVYKEWHDSRLWPWVHFVPMDNTFVDLYGIMQYFLGHEKGARPHDDVAQKIAEDGSEWASKVLRREDMTVYMYRLILEFARVSTDRRLKMAYIADLLETQTPPP